MNSPLAAATRIWRPTVPQRLLMLGAAALYAIVLIMRAPERGGSWMYYSGVAVIVILAVLAGRWRLGAVLACVFGVLLVIGVAANFLGMPN
jgi:hypothetical protein